MRGGIRQALPQSSTGTTNHSPQSQNAAQLVAGACGGERTSAESFVFTDSPGFIVSGTSTPAFWKMRLSCTTFPAGDSIDVSMTFSRSSTKASACRLSPACSLLIVQMLMPQTRNVPNSAASVTTFLSCCCLSGWLRRRSALAGLVGWPVEARSLCMSVNCHAKLDTGLSKPRTATVELRWNPQRHHCLGAC